MSRSLERESVLEAHIKLRDRVLNEVMPLLHQVSEVGGLNGEPIESYRARVKQALFIVKTILEAE